MSLPPEIRHDIALHFVRLGSDPWFHFIRAGLQDPHAALYRMPLCRQYYDDDDSLYSLRLVSHAWNGTVTKILQEHFWWPIYFTSRESVDRAAASCNPGNGRPTTLRWLPRRLEVSRIYESLSFRRTYTEDPELVNKFGNRGPYAERHQFQDRVRENFDHTPAQFHHDKSHEHAMLRQMFGAVDKVEAFALAFPCPESGHSPLDCHRDSSWADCYDIQAIEQVAATIRCGLESDAFQHLTDLRLALPCTRDLERFSGSIKQDARNRLKHLSIRILDDTGQDGNMSLEPFATDVEDGECDGASAWEWVQPSNLQSDFPNKRHQGHLWDFVGSCPSLDSLCVSGTHFLDLDRLDWDKCTASGGIRVLTLERIWASIPSIIKLLRPSPASSISSRALVIRLDQVKIRAGGGDWSDFFKYLREECPELLCTSVEQLTYFSSHENYATNRSYTKDYFAMWTQRQQDWQELGKLANHLISKVGGGEFYMDPNYRVILEKGRKASNDATEEENQEEENQEEENQEGENPESDT